MFESVGLLRTVGSFLAATGALVKYWYPETGELLLTVGASIGGIGVARAGVAGTLWNVKKLK